MSIDPIQSGDGSQAAVASAPRAPGFTPTPPPTNGTNVAAPLDVRAAPSQASILATQLTNSLQQLRWPMMQAERAHGEQVAKQSYAQGSGDALANQVDDDVMAKDANYRAGVVRVRAQRSMIMASDAWQQWVADPKNNVAGMSPTQFVQAHDEFMRRQLGGLEQDPVAVDALMPLIQHSANESLGRFLQFKHQQNFSDGLTTSVQLAQAQLQHGGNLFDYEKQLSTLTALAVGAGGSRSDAKAALDNSLIQAAVAGHDGALMKFIQPAPGQSGLSAATQAKIAEATDSITRYNNEQAQQGIQRRQFGILSAWDDSLAKKIPIAESAIREAVNNKDISPQSGLSYLNRSNDLRERLATQASAFHVLNTAPANWYAYVGQQIPGAKLGKVYTKEMFQYAADQNIARLPLEQQAQAAFQLTQTSGLTYSPLQSTLNNKPLNTSQGIKDVLQAYHAMNSMDATVTGKYFNDPKRLADVHKLDSMQQSGMSYDDIANWVQKHAAQEGNIQTFSMKGAKLQQTLNNWSIGTDDGSKLKLSEFANAGVIQSRVQAAARQIGQSGLYSDPQEILQEAQRQVLNSSYVIHLSPGYSLMMPFAKSDPPAGTSQRALQWFYDKQLPKLVKDARYSGDPTDVRLVPNPTQPGTLDLVDRFYNPVGRASYTLHNIVAKYSEDLRSGREHLDVQQAERALNSSPMAVE